MTAADRVSWVVFVPCAHIAKNVNPCSVPSKLCGPPFFTFEQAGELRWWVNEKMNGFTRFRVFKCEFDRPEEEPFSLQHLFPRVMGPVADDRRVQFRQMPSDLMFSPGFRETFDQAHFAVV